MHTCADCPGAKEQRRFSFLNGSQAPPSAELYVPRRAQHAWANPFGEPASAAHENAHRVGRSRHRPEDKTPVRRVRVLASGRCSQGDAGPLLKRLRTPREPEQQRAHSRQRLETCGGRRSPHWSACSAAQALAMDAVAAVLGDTSLLCALAQLMLRIQAGGPWETYPGPQPQGHLASSPLAEPRFTIVPYGLPLTHRAVNRWPCCRGPGQPDAVCCNPSCAPPRLFGQARVCTRERARKRRRLQLLRHADAFVHASARASACARARDRPCTPHAGGMHARAWMRTCILADPGGGQWGRPWGFFPLERDCGRA